MSLSLSIVAILENRPEQDNWMALIHEPDKSGQDQFQYFVHSICELTCRTGQTGLLESPPRLKIQYIIYIFNVNKLSKEKLKK